MTKQYVRGGGMVAIRLREDLRRQIDDQASRLGMTRSDLIREALVLRLRELAERKDRQRE